MLRTLSLGWKQPESLMKLFFVTKTGKSISGFLTEGDWLSHWDVLKEEDLGSSGPDPRPTSGREGCEDKAKWVSEEILTSLTLQ